MSKKREYIWRVKLGEILIKKGLTQTDLSKKTGLRQATISELVNNTRTIINKNHLSVIMDALDLIDMNDILELHVVEKEERPLN
jgi:putative transcriptional regulator